jgi:hypothetical protein
MHAFSVWFFITRYPRRECQLELSSFELLGLMDAASKLGAAVVRKNVRERTQSKASR